MPAVSYDNFRQEVYLRKGDFYMKTARNLKEHYSDDEKVRSVIEEYLSLDIGQLRGEQVPGSNYFSVLVDDVIRNEDFDDAKCEDMTLGEFLKLMSSSKTSLSYSYIDSTYNEVVTSIENYMFCVQSLALSLFGMRTSNRTVGRLMKLPLQRILDVMYEGCQRKARKYVYMLSLEYRTAKKAQWCDLNEINMEDMIECLSVSANRSWTPAQMPIEQYKRKREELCITVGCLVVEMFIDSPNYVFDKEDIVKRYKSDEPDNDDYLQPGAYLEDGDEYSDTTKSQKG